MEQFTFNELPEMVRQLFEKIERIELLLAQPRPTKETENDLMYIEEAAAFLRVSLSSLYFKVSRNEIPFSKPGKRLYFSKKELKKWVRSNKRNTT